MSETIIVKQVRVQASDLGARLFRNNTGKLQDSNGRWVEFGLCVGSADLIGWDPVLITTDMVGQTLAQFVAVECKTVTGKATEAQIAFLETVRRAGGKAGIARDKDELAIILRPLRGQHG